MAMEQNFHFILTLLSKCNDRMSVVFNLLLVVITLVVFPSEACPGISPVVTTPGPTPAPPSPTTTKAPAYECPIGGEKSKGFSFIGGGNVLAIEANINNVLDYSKYWIT